jgi:DNA recombination protein RmuC
MFLKEKGNVMLMTIFLATTLISIIFLIYRFFEHEKNIVKKMEEMLLHQREISKLQMAEIIEEKFRSLGHGQQIHFQNLSDRFMALQQNVTGDLFKMSEKINKELETKLNAIRDRFKENLDQGFKKTNDTFNSVIERLAKIDEAQKKIELLSSNVVSLQDVLTDKKSRGIFGEVQLQQVLNSVFGDRNDKVFALQYKLSNGTICDSILFLPEPTGKLVVDSKFPLENFRRMFDAKNSEIDKKDATREFKINLKKHIDDISSKYIITGETSDQAVLFLPAEAIFAELYAYHGDIIEYAQEKRVWITSPTTFMAMLTTIQVVLNNIERSKYTNVIHQELIKLSDEFVRYKKRWDSLATHIDTVTKDVKDIHTTTEKITSRFQHISEVNIEHLNTPLIK